LGARKNTADYLIQPGWFVKRFFAFDLKTITPMLPGLHDEQVYQQKASRAMGGRFYQLNFFLELTLT